MSLKSVSPAELGLCPERWQGVLDLAQQLCETGALPALALQVQREGLTTGTHGFGSRSLSEPLAVDDDTVFLLASLTKPVVAMATLLLVERGVLSLNQRVVEFLPSFRDAAKRPITIRHLLAHTSGLPDMLPENLELRRSRAPLTEFVSRTYSTELCFPPGRSAQYQSMGYALLGPILQQVTGRSLPQFLRQEIFDPLGMRHSWLGLPADWIASPQIAEVQVPPAQATGADWNWNSPYWRTLGAPWGGMFSTVGDFSRFCRACFASKGSSGPALFSRDTIREATTSRLGDFPSIPEAERRSRGWGYGWRMNWKHHRSCFCELLPDDVFGHWGATGTVCWLDPRRELAVVLLSTLPLTDEVSPLTRLSNAIAAAFR